MPRSDRAEVGPAVLILAGMVRDFLDGRLEPVAIGDDPPSRTALRGPLGRDAASDGSNA